MEREGRGGRGKEVRGGRRKGEGKEEEEWKKGRGGWPPPF